MFIVLISPNHLSLVWCKTSTILTAPKQFLNSADDFLSLRQILHIYWFICKSVWEILLILLSFRGYYIVLYSITLLTHAVYNISFNLCENTVDVRRGKSSLIFFSTWSYTRYFNCFCMSNCSYYVTKIEELISNIIISIIKFNIVVFNICNRWFLANCAFETVPHIVQTLSRLPLSLFHCSCTQWA